VEWRRGILRREGKEWEGWGRRRGRKGGKGTNEGDGEKRGMKGWDGIGKGRGKGRGRGRGRGSGGEGRGGKGPETDPP
jgi:hypothetical protein